MADDKSKTENNKHGLPRYIDADVRRTIRQACGFGCVICGNALVEYEHIDPEFADATKHDPDRMALLCGACHGHVTRKRWSKNLVKEARANPKCRQTGWSFDALDTGPDPITVVIGPLTFRNPTVVIRVLDVDVLRIDKPEIAGAPMRLSANFLGPNRAPIYQAVDNEVRVNAKNWDAEMKGDRTTIRNAAGKTVLGLRTAPRQPVVVEELHMHFGGAVVDIDGKRVSVVSPSGATMHVFEGECSNNSIGINVMKEGVGLFEVGAEPVFGTRLRVVVPAAR